MKKLFLISMMLVATLSFAAAQQGGGQGQRQGGQRQMQTPEERVKAQVERVDKACKLTADQKTKIQTIETDLGKEQAALRQNNQGGNTDWRATMEEFDKKRDEKYKAVLTADQFKKYLADKEEQRKEREARMEQMRQRQRN